MPVIHPLHAAPQHTRPCNTAGVWGGVRVSPLRQVDATLGKTPPECNSCRPHVAARPPAHERGPLPAGPAAPAGGTPRRGSPRPRPAPRQTPPDPDRCHTGHERSRLFRVQETQTPRFPRLLRPRGRTPSRSPRYSGTHRPAVENPTAALRFPCHGLIRTACQRTAKPNRSRIPALPAKLRGARRPPPGKAPSLLSRGQQTGPPAGSGTGRGPPAGTGARTLQVPAAGDEAGVEGRRGEPASPQQPRPGWESSDGPEPRGAEEDQSGRPAARPGGVGRGALPRDG